MTRWVSEFNSDDVDMEMHWDPARQRGLDSDRSSSSSGSARKEPVQATHDWMGNEFSLETFEEASGPPLHRASSVFGRQKTSATFVQTLRAPANLDQM
jgi:hypothetical protein